MSTILTPPVLITLSGSPGSGKSTIAQRVSEEIGATRIYIGEIRRTMAAERGMTLQDLNRYAIDHPETDVDVDRRASEEARELYSEGKSVLVEGRTQFHHIPESLKLYIFCTPEIGGERIYRELQRKNGRNESVGTLGDAIAGVIAREEGDAQRYLKYYCIDHRDQAHYDHVIDSSHATPDAVFSDVMDIIRGQKKLS